METFKSGNTYWYNDDPYHNPYHNRFVEVLIKEGFAYIEGTKYPIITEIISRELPAELILISLSPMVGIWASQYPAIYRQNNEVNKEENK